MTLIWSPQAIRDLIEVRTFIAAENPAAARRVVAGILRHVAAMLRENPAAGRVGRVPGTRELVVPRTPFIVPYRVRGGTLQILRVYHGARRWPDRL
jgi:toxin ParE1/3/4